MANRFTMDERNECLKLAVCRKVFSLGFDALARRIASIKGAKRDMALCAKLIDKTLDAIKGTLEPEQQYAFEKSLIGVSYEIMTRCPATANNPTRTLRENGMWQSFEVYNWLLEGCAEGCKYCDKSTEQQMKCGTRKAMNAIPHNDGPDDDGKGKCPYYAFKWGNEK